MSMPWIFPLSPTPPDFALDWDAVVAMFPWLETLRGCRQNPVFHAEGDVFTHTRMVSEALARDEAWRALDPTQRGMLFASALLHDIGKPPTTEIVEGRIKAPGHARKGAHMANQILYQDWNGPQRIPLDVRRRVVALVRYHGIPLFLLENPSLQRVVIKSSLAAPNSHIATLARADIGGRICPDADDLYERTALFEEYCAEQACLDTPFIFPSDHTRFVYFRTEDRSPLVEAYDDTKSEVVLMSGLPGAGKDTWLRENLPGWPAVSLDAIRGELDVDPAEPQGPVVDRAHELARGYLRDGVNFVWNATNVTLQMRRMLIDFFASYNARVRIVYVETPWPELVRRNKTRSRPVPDSVLNKLAEKLEVPDLSEAHQVEWVET